MKKSSKKENNFKEFEFEGKNGNHFSGRVFEMKEGENCDRYPLSIVINGLAIKGAAIVHTEKKDFLALPQYKDGKEYKSQVYFFEKDDIKDQEDFVAYFAKVFIND